MVVALAVIGATCCVCGVGWCLAKVLELFERVDDCEQNLDRLFEKKNEFLKQIYDVEKRLRCVEMKISDNDENERRM